MGGVSGLLGAWGTSLKRKYPTSPRAWATARDQSPIQASACRRYQKRLPGHLHSMLPAPPAGEARLIGFNPAAGTLGACMRYPK